MEADIEQRGQVSDETLLVGNGMEPAVDGQKVQ